MNTRHPLTSALSLALALAITSPVFAQSTAPTPAQRKQLEAARAELDQAAGHLAELSRKYGDNQDPVWVHKQKLRTPVVGVLLAPDDQSGVRIAGVTPDGAAADAGLKSGDRLLAINGHTVLGSDGETRVDNAKKLLGDLDEKTTVKLDYLRDGRKASVSLKPRIGERMVFLPDSSTGPGDVRVIRMRTDGKGVATDNIYGIEPAIERDVHRELIRIGPDGECKGEDCKFPVFAEAMRWNGLNLASVDAKLGRYFGADQGVLVLSAGEDLPGLQPGDVIRRIDGKPVATPREAMETLRGRKTGSHVAVEYLRDRKTATTQLTVPKPMQWRIPPPPPPPAPPAPPAAPTAPGAPGAKATAPHTVEHRQVVWVDDKGEQHVIQDNVRGPLPADVQRAQSRESTKTVERRKIVFVDKDGKVQAWEDDGSGPVPPPPPPPPAPPAPPPPPPAN